MYHSYKHRKFLVCPRASYSNRKMQALTARKSMILCLALALSAYCYAQDLTVGNALPCGDDNLSCASGEECYNRTELCDGTAICPAALINGLDCKHYHTCIYNCIALALCSFHNNFDSGIQVLVILVRQ